MKNWEKKAIAEIMGNFDFDKVQKHMDSVGWKWGTEIPSAREIEAEAFRMLNKVVKEKLIFIETGGLVAIRIKKMKVISLYFKIEGWDNC
jgi:hypothetical protein